MKEPLSSRLKHAWNAFTNKDPTQGTRDLGPSASYRPDRSRVSYGNEKSIVNSIYNRLAIDVAAVPILHVRTDQNGRYLETMASDLNECLAVSANIDQTGRALIQDIAMSLFDEGCVAIVPTETSVNPTTGAYNIYTMRVGKILEWFPQHVRVKLYNERTGYKEDIVLPKKMVAIVENPLYAVMNEQNSILKRLIAKLNLLDAIDNQSGSGKLDLIIQLPYVIKTESRKEQAMNRRKDLEEQLSGSKYGIAYTDGTEKVTQLNRPTENNLMKQIEFLTAMLYGQLGLTTSIFDGTADEETMLNYYNRTTEPVLAAIVDSMERTFLSKTARTQRQAVMFFREPFKLLSTKSLAEIGDSLTRNEILSSNELRAVIGYKPVDDPKAEELRNKNLNDPNAAQNGTDPTGSGEMDTAMNDMLAQLEAEIDSLMGGGKSEG